ncbi:MAG: hypothetical protein AB7V18_14640 [Pyrinomonadaceae bacterium]
MLKIFGIIVLLGSLLLLVVGVGGAVMNFVFPPVDLVCKYAEEDFKKADAAAKRYEAAKGTPDEYSAKAAAEQAIKTASASSESCGRMKDSYRFYGMIFSGVGVVGFVGVLLGAVLTFLGFRKRKRA